MKYLFCFLLLLSCCTYVQCESIRNCQCKDCKCIDLDAIYKDCIEKDRIVVLAIDCKLPISIISSPGSSPLFNQAQWKIINLKKLTGEESGFIIGVPKDGELIRIDLPTTATLVDIKLSILNVIKLRRFR